MSKKWAAVVWLEKKIFGSATKISRDEFENQFLFENSCDGNAHVWRKLGGSKHAGNFGKYSRQLIRVCPETAGADDRKAFRVYQKTLDCITCNDRFVFEMFRSQREGEGKTNETAHSMSHHTLITCCAALGSREYVSCSYKAD